jgi:hypothetical protein
MATNPNPATDVLHNDNHSKLTAEQIAKAVARHNRDHTGTPTDKASVKRVDRASAKSKKPTKS